MTIQTSKNITRSYHRKLLRDAIDKANKDMKYYDEKGQYDVARGIEREIFIAQDLLNDPGTYRADLINSINNLNQY